MDRYLITVQAVVTVVLLAFAGLIYLVGDSTTASVLATAITTGVMTHWFKESSTIARKASTTVEVAEGDVTVEEAPKAKATTRRKTTRQRDG